MVWINNKVEEVYSDEIIDKDLVAEYKEKIELPVYVIENLIYKSGIQDLNNTEIKNVIQAIKEKIVNPKQNLKIQAKIRSQKEVTIIDKVRAKAITGRDSYWAQLVNLGAKKVKVSNDLIEKYPQLLETGLWAEIKVSYLDSKATKQSEFEIEEFNSYQDTDFDLDKFKEKAAEFTGYQWRVLLLRSIGLEAQNYSQRKQLLLLSRLLPLVEKNYNFVELGPRGTGKSYLYRQLFSESLLVSGGKTTVANLFYNMGTKEVGLVGKWNVVAFDEVAYVDFKDKTAIQILKDYMESGAFSRGKEEIFAQASMVFLGNINNSVKALLNDGHLFEPFPELMQDLALIDRFHFYLPGWEIDKFKEDDFTLYLGLRCEYLSHALNDLRELDFTDVIDDYFTFTEELDVRDKTAIKKTVSGYLKLLHPHGEFTKKDLKMYLDLALEGRKRVKEQLVKLGSFEYKETTYKYIDLETKEEYYPALLEQSVESGFTKQAPKPGTVYVAQMFEEHKFAILKLEIMAEPGEGKLIFLGELSSGLKNYIRKAFLAIKQREAYNHLYAMLSKIKDEIRVNDFYVKATPILNEVEADISRPFVVAMYSLLKNKSITNGFLVSEDSSLYRDYDSNGKLEPIKVEEDGGQIKALVPLSKDDVFVEIPQEVISRISNFMKV